MQKISINVDSWHSKFIQRYSSYTQYDMSKINNLCGYVRKFVWAVLGCLFLWALAGYAAYCVMSTIIWIMVIIDQSQYISPNFSTAVVLIIFACMFIMVSMGILIWGSQKLYTRFINDSDDYNIGDIKKLRESTVVWNGHNWVEQTRTSFLMLCWLRIKSWHEKICLPVTVRGTRFNDE